jgi:phosphoribosylpyrophosphate synthetase
MHHMAMNRNVHKHTLIDADYFESDHAQFVFKTLDKLLINLGHFSDQEIETYIEEDIKDETVSTIFDLLNSHYKYNTWMMHFIYDMRANNNPDLYQLRISI